MPYLTVLCAHVMLIDGASNAMCSSHELLDRESCVDKQTSKLSTRLLKNVIIQLANWFRFDHAIINDRDVGKDALSVLQLFQNLVVPIHKISSSPSTF
jgi:hypothetical protein